MKAPKTRRYTNAIFHLWALQQAAAIREHSWLDVDTTNLTEELGYLAAAQVNAMESQLRRLFWHMLKISINPNGTRARGTTRSRMQSKICMIFSRKAHRYVKKR